MARTLVHAHHRLAGRTRCQAEGLAAIRIEPRMLEADTLLVLDRQVTSMGLRQLVPGHAEEARMNIHELGHPHLLAPV